MLNIPQKVFALTCTNASILERSSSGGAFSVLALPVLREGGIVCGAIMKDDGIVCHTLVERQEELDSLRGSKYVKSDSAAATKDCIDALRAGKKVLYSGLPCEVSIFKTLAVKEFGERYLSDKLLCVDLICHGTPSQELFSANLLWLTDKLGADEVVRNYKFRDKHFGWRLCYSYQYKKRGKNHKVFGLAGDDPYYFSFAGGFTYRKCCYSCNFAQKGRVGDFTIGDFHGIEKCLPAFNNRMGVSCLLVNTAAAEKFFFDKCAELCTYHECAFEDAAAENTNLQRPSAKPAGYEELSLKIAQALERHEYSKIFEEYLPISMSWGAKIRRVLPKPLLWLYFKMH